MSRTTGEGHPVTLFVHGLTGSVPETRPFGSGVAGSRVFVDLPGHGDVPFGDADTGWPALEARVEADRAASGATRALGVSVGAGVVLRLLAAGAPLERAVLVLPAATLLRPLPAAVLARYAAMAEAVEAGDVEGLARLLREQQPAAVRDLPAVRVWSRRRAGELVRTPVAGALRAWPRLPAPVPDEALRAVVAPVLVVAQEGDDVHPLGAAEHLAALLPAARLEVLPAGAVPWTGRSALRALVAGFLDAPGPGRWPSPE